MASSPFLDSRESYAERGRESNPSVGPVGVAGRDTRGRVLQATHATWIHGIDSVAGLELAYIGRAFGLCSDDPDSEWWGAVEYTNDGCVDGADLSVLGALFGCSDAEPGCGP